MKEYIEELYEKNGLNDLDKHNGAVTHLEPDILKCEVKWALRSITTNKAGGGDEFQPLILEMLKLLFKVLHLIHQQI